VGAVYVGPKAAAAGAGQSAVPAQLKYAKRIDPKVMVARN
jgi:hypothetical protein